MVTWKWSWGYGKELWTICRWSLTMRAQINKTLQKKWKITIKSLKGQVDNQKACNVLNRWRNNTKDYVQPH